MNTKKTLKKLRENERSLFIIHYSCQNLNDNNENYSPRITSIAVLHVDSSTMHSFSIHLIAEINNIPRENIHDHYDDLEKEMLTQFFAFLSENSNGFWLHWNMSNINYGFEALIHRYKVLSNTDGKRISDSKKYNLSSLILSVYGKNCVKHPRMENFMELNDGGHRDNLSGKEEVEAFTAKEYVKLHKSTMSKAYWFRHMYYLLQKNKVNVYNKNWSNKVNTFSERPVVKMLSFLAVIFTLFQAVQISYSTLELEKKANSATQEQTNKLLKKQGGATPSI